MQDSVCLTLVGLKVICVPSKWIRNLVFSAPQARWWFHTCTLTYIHTQISPTPGILTSCHTGFVLFHFHSQTQIAPSPPFFFFLLDIIKSSNSHTEQSFCLSFCPPPPHPLFSTSAFLSLSSVTRWELWWIYSPADSKQSYREEQSIHGRPEQFIQSRATKLLHSAGLINSRQLHLWFCMYSVFLISQCSRVYNHGYMYVKWIDVR